MQWKFQREDHNRQDKAKKPDYREDFLAESNYKATPLHLESFKEILLFKSELIRRYEQGAYFLEHRHLRLHWSLKQYAQVNKLEALVNRRYKPHRAAAIQDVRAIRDAIRNAQAVWGFSRKGQQQPQVIFTVRLRCDCVIPYKTDDDEIEAKRLIKSVG